GHFRDALVCGQLLAAADVEDLRGGGIGGDAVRALADEDRGELALELARVAGLLREQDSLDAQARQGGTRGGEVGGERGGRVGGREAGRCGGSLRGGRVEPELLDEVPHAGERDQQHEPQRPDAGETVQVAPRRARI